MKYPKLVRDKIPEIIKRDGKKATIHAAKDDEYLGLLLEKLIEESIELKQAQGLDNKIEEMADLLEVLEALKNALYVNEELLLDIKSKKQHERGGFKKRIVVDAIK